jgi:dihydrodipicolinate synthase/N-acetylneuraminate lyase
VVRRPDAAGGARLSDLRSALEQQPFQAALKQALHARGVPVRTDVRAPLPPLTPDQAQAVDALAVRASDGSGVA